MKIEYQNPWFKVIKNGKFHFIKENGSDNGAVILALVDGKFLFVKVDRPAHEMISVEAPRGYGEPGESSESCAVRELYEETGFLFSSSNLEKIGVVRPNPAILSSSIPVYFIQESNLSSKKLPDPEVLGVILIPENEIHKEIAKGKITDGITLSALSLFWATQHNKQSQSGA